MILISDSDEGKWVCFLESYPTKGLPFTSVEASTFISVIEPPIVELKGPSQLPVTLNSKHQFMCVARGSPRPERIEWYISDNPITALDTVQANGSTTEGDFVQVCPVKEQFYKLDITWLPKAVWPWHLEDWGSLVLTLHLLQPFTSKGEVPTLARDGPWPNPTRTYFWPAVIKRLTWLWPGYFLTRPDDIFFDPNISVTLGAWKQTSSKVKILDAIIFHRMHVCLIKFG